MNNTATNDYLQRLSQYITISGETNSQFTSGEVGVVKKDGISPQLYFRYIKKKFGLLEGLKLSARLKKLENAFNKAVENGQEALGEKMIREIAIQTRESMMYAKGIKMFVEKSVVQKHKHNIKGGHISDTLLREYTRIIPTEILAKKKKFESIFDDFVIYHYFEKEIEKKREEKQKMTSEETSKMRDPILFGIIKENNRLYFIADWEDEYCDLSFEEMVDLIGLDENDVKLTREPKL